MYRINSHTAALPGLHGSATATARAPEGSTGPGAEDLFHLAKSVGRDAEPQTPGDHHALEFIRDPNAFFEDVRDAGKKTTEVAQWTMTHGEHDVFEQLVLRAPVLELPLNAFIAADRQPYFQSLCATLPRNKRLTTLELCRCFDADAGIERMAGAGIRLMANALGKCVQLQVLDLSDNHIGPAGASLIASKLAHCTHLTSLDMSDNAMGDEGAANLCAGLASLTSLTALELNDTGAGDRTLQAAATLVRCIPLQKLGLEYCELPSRRGVQAMADALCGNRALRELRLSVNPLYLGDLPDPDEQDAIIEPLLRVLRTNRCSLAVLNISGLTSLAAVADMLMTNTSLERVHAHFAFVDNAGVCKLSRAIKANPSLLEFRFPEDELTEIETRMLVGAWEVNRRLKRFLTLDPSPDWWEADNIAERLRLLRQRDTPFGAFMAELRQHYIRGAMGGVLLSSRELPLEMGQHVGSFVSCGPAVTGGIALPS
jgi:hypothetical protein